MISDERLREFAVRLLLPDYILWKDDVEAAVRLCA